MQLEGNALSVIIFPQKIPIFLYLKKISLFCQLTFFWLISLI